MDEHMSKSERRELRRQNARSRSRIKIAVWILLAAVVVGGLIWFFISDAKNNPTAGQDPLTILSDDYVKGPQDAPVTLIEYLDFECEICGMYFPLLKQLQKDFPDDLKIVTRYYPLPGHKNGLPAALAVEAAARQGKYNEMHDLLFTEQKKWGEKNVADLKVFEAYAEQLGLDMNKYKEDVSSQSVEDRVRRDMSSGTRLGNTGTPSFYLNGEKMDNPKTYENLKTLIQAAIIKAPKRDEPVLGEKVHEHADFAVYLDGKKFDFKQDKYQSSDTNPLDSNAHLHDGNGDVTHKHRKGVTLGFFFKTIGMKFDNKCFATDDGKEYCTSGDKRLRMFVNGQPNEQLGKYEFSDLDKILITYGNETDLSSQLASLSDDACMYSEKCPERGVPPTENCVGGLGEEC